MGKDLHQAVSLNYWSVNHHTRRVQASSGGCTEATSYTQPYTRLLLHAR